MGMNPTLRPSGMSTDSRGTWRWPEWESETGS